MILAMTPPMVPALWFKVVSSHFLPAAVVLSFSSQYILIVSYVPNTIDAVSYTHLDVYKRQL